MSSRWAELIPPASHGVACGAEIHQLIWRGGELLVPAHSDPEAERALAALGGPACRCVELLDAWCACVTDPRVLVLGPRGTDAVPAWPDSPGRRARLARSGADPLSAVLSLGDQLPRRLVATVAHALAGREVHPALVPMLHMAVLTRVRTSLRRWQGRAAPDITLELVSTRAERSLTGSAAEGLRARLPLEWVVEVWGPELDIVSGRFTLSVESMESAESAEPAEPAESAEPAEPAEPAESAESAEPTESRESRESIPTAAGVERRLLSVDLAMQPRTDRFIPGADASGGVAVKR